MQKCKTILGVIEMREQQTPYDICQSRFHIGSSVVTNVMKRYTQLGFSLEELQQMSPSEVEELFYPKDRRRRKKVPLPDFEEIHRKISAEGSKMTGYMLWLEYRKENPDGYSYSQFQTYYKEYVQETYGTSNVKMVVHRVPGERMYVDWMGDQPQLLLDSETGEVKPVHFFCATLGVSSMGYAEAFENESLENFITGIVHALEYFGALPKYIVTDNLRAAVTKHDRNTLVLTSACEDLENFYDVVILPPPARKPRGKATVEWYVGYTERNLVEPLKGQVYPSIDDVMQKARPIVDELNDRIDRGRSISKRAAFRKIDLPRMRPLPAEAFTIWKYAAVLKVPETYHVTYDKHRYSVPYQYAGKQVMIKASMSEIVITDSNNKLVAKHKRSYNDFPRDFTDPMHLAPSHRFYQDVNEMDGSKYRNWAASIGPATSALVDVILNAASHEEQMYESCTSLMYHAADIAPKIVEDAAVMCIASQQTSCTAFRAMITRLANTKTTPADPMPEHENMRGEEYYV